MSTLNRIGSTGTRAGFEKWATERVRRGLPITNRDVSIGPDGRVRSSLGRTTIADLWPVLVAGGGIGLGALAAGGPAAGGAGGAGATGGGVSLGEIASAGGLGFGGFGTAGGGFAAAGAGAGTAGASAGGGSFMQRLGNLLRTRGSSILGAAGRASGAAAETAASNRGAELEGQEALLDAQQREDQMGVLTARDRREMEVDALRKAQQAAYLTGGGSNFGRTPATEGLPRYGFGPTAPTAEEQEIARLLQGQMIDRVRTPYEAPDYSQNIADMRSLLRPSGVERTLGYASPVLTGVGSVLDAYNRRNDDPSLKIATILKDLGLLPGGRA